jgi:hypothetical protein
MRHPTFIQRARSGPFARRGIALGVMMIGRKLVRMGGREWALTAVVGIAWYAVWRRAER